MSEIEMHEVIFTADDAQRITREAIEALDKANTRRAAQHHHKVESAIRIAAHEGRESTEYTGIENEDVAGFVAHHFRERGFNVGVVGRIIQISWAPRPSGPVKRTKETA